ncbi:MAG TPA: 30S ribosomal protein S9 [candidate division Zixibacteria bacterium]|nr:30S ribosomal protein S9 [candidate division Zixibacteria bacterium]
MSTKRIVLTSGKRKTAIARATTKAGRGRIRINSIPLEVYPSELARMKIQEPLVLAGDEVVKSLDITVNVFGGGIIGQADAARTAVGRAIVKWTQDPELRSKFMHYDRSILVADSRRREDKKPGGPGARARYQKSYR